MDISETASTYCYKITPEVTDASSSKGDTFRWKKFQWNHFRVNA